MNEVQEKYNPIVPGPPEAGLEASLSNASHTLSLWDCRNVGCFSGSQVGGGQTGLWR